MARTRASDFEEKQHGLLLTAANVFATQGMEKASMSQIAQEAGVSKSLLYHYYPSKGALIFAIIHSHLAILDQALEKADEALLRVEGRHHLPFP
ncbi:MAG: helix-turn-helix domain-containing protein, partial [Roseibium album]|uniref:TetR/AcrR family transcriptional regulator n=1 Tax=Roseibium album TaxID=311410 RepID=UPI0032EBD860